MLRLLVFSAGLGDILVEVMKAFEVYHKSNTKVVSNFLTYDANGRVIGCQGRITLSFIAEKMDKMKNIQNFMLNNILCYHFSERTC